LHFYIIYITVSSNFFISMGGFLPEPIKTKTVHKGQNS
jgi:hypothetical protein